MLPFKTIKELKDLKGKKILLRLDLNLPMENGVVRSDFRVRKILPTIEYLKKSEAKIAIISHIGEDSESLKPAAKRLGEFVQAGFIPSLSPDLIREAMERLPLGGVTVLENLRREAGEKENDVSFAKRISSLFDIYVNDAFSASHRRHASIIGVPKFLPSYAGLLFEEEYENLSKMFNPKKPFLFILGGAKFETKFPLVNKYLPLSETIFIGGGLANPLFKLKGYETGKSVLGEPIPGLEPLIFEKKIMLPKDVRLLSGKICAPDELSEEDKIVDIGPETVMALGEKINKAKSILFNGPVGIYNEGFGWGTEEILKLLAKSKAETTVGGGDTLALVTELKLEYKFSFVSTGGGAMLEFLATGMLPGIEALKKNN